MNPHRESITIPLLEGDTDGRRTLRTHMILGTVATAVMISVYTAAQTVRVLSTKSSGAGTAPAEMTARLAVNLGGVALLVVGILLLAPERRRGLDRILTVLGISIVAGLLRGAAKIPLGIYDLGLPGHRTAFVSEVIGSIVLAIFSLIIGILTANGWARARALDQRRLEAQENALRLLRDVQDEELRLRRELAETIHGSVQGTFVVLEAQLRHLARHPETAEPAKLEQIAAHLAALREGDLRAMSSQLYPADLDRGVDAAVRTLAARMPAWLVVDDHATEVLAGIQDRLIQEARVLIVRVVEEGLSNALKHAQPQRICIRAILQDDLLTVLVANDGGAKDGDAALSGLARLRRRAATLEGDLTIGSDPGQDATALMITIPVGAGRPAVRTGGVTDRSVTR